MLLGTSDKVSEQSAQENAPKNELHGPSSVVVKQREYTAGRFAPRKRVDPERIHAQMQLAVEAKVRETNPWLLGTKQGVIDLRTGSLRTGLPDDHLLAMIPTRWRGLDEPAPRFEQFLRELFADREETEHEALIAFLQRALGYGISGHAYERIFLVFSGDGGCNGKKTLLHTLEHVLGKAVVMLPGDMFLTAAPQSTQSLLGRLRGKRLAWASVTNHHVRLDSEQIRLLTGSEAITARQPYGKTFTFTPSHLLLLLTDHKPEPDRDEGIFGEHLCQIPFNMRFVARPERPNELPRDAALARALEAEASGILAWLVRGAQEWMRFGLAIPASVRQSCLASNKQENSVEDFVRQCCVLDPAAHTRAGVLYKHYRVWAEEHRHSILDNKQFGQELEQIEQVTREHNKHGTVYVGIRFNVENESSN